MWKYTGKSRPPFAEPVRDGQESVWDYPRPPVTSPDSRKILVKLNGRVLAESNSVVRVLETASPPSFYIPPDDVNRELLQKASGSSFCEWKGSATYWDVHAGNQIIQKAGWSYHNPSERFAAIDGYFSFYPALVNCFVDGEQVVPQPGGFYGGWITSEIVGPVKGGPGTGGW
ncbi:MAG: DUF427 domain-containing protein [Balneolaceae bacterium]|nr:MAG: DUF427 domain-containing protein [Balneolaceae bacterium]